MALSLALGVTSGQAQGTPPLAAASAAQAVDMKRYRALSKIVDRHVGHAHFMRGMNRKTLLALGRAVTPADVAVLAAMMNDKDRVVAMTAMKVLPTLGPEGVQAFKQAQSPFSEFDREVALREASALRRALDEDRQRHR